MLETAENTKLRGQDPLTSALYLTKKRKRLYDLTPDGCGGAQTFAYNGRAIWNGF